MGISEEDNITTRYDDDDDNDDHNEKFNIIYFNYSCA